MSLQIAAQHLASRGRGPDTQLVHMAPQEVAGLHALAKAHGGSLTTNPDTGLPEAGFLSSLLPTLIGVGLSIASGGTLTPLMAAGITGAGYGVATGSLKKGLMAGLGAYGGAGLASGLTAAGAVGAETGLTASGGVMGANPMVAQPMTFGAGPEATSVLGSGPAAYNPVTSSHYVDPGLGVSFPTPPPPAYTANPEAFASNAYTSSPASSIQTATPEPTPIADNFSKAGQGFKNLGTEAGRNAFMSKEGVDGGMGLLKYGYAAGLPLLMQEPEEAKKKAEEKPWMYSYDQNRVADPQEGYTGAYTGERTYFNPVYTRTAAGGGLMDIGPVQAMSDRNEAQTLMVNNGQMFAEGGETKAVKPVEENPYYTMSGQSGDAFKYLMGQMPAPSKAQAPAAAPAPAQPVAATVQPAAETQKSIVNRLVSGLTGSDSDATMRPYTFDPVTGTFTAMPISNPAFDGTDVNPFYGFSPEYGSDGGGAGASAAASGVGGGMSNSGEGGGAAGEGGWANGGLLSLAQGGQSHLGDYSDGGRLLKGPGDGVSDSIPATIANKRPARLADGEFVVPARIVSELGNGSTEAGARKLYAMMDRVQNARKKSIGKDRVAVNSRTEKLLPV